MFPGDVALISYEQPCRHGRLVGLDSLAQGCGRKAAFASSSKAGPVRVDSWPPESLVRRIDSVESWPTWILVVGSCDVEEWCSVVITN